MDGTGAVAQMGSIETAGRLGLALAMAIFLGLTFEGIYKLAERSSPGGIRSFPMLTTVGAALYLLQPASLLPFVAGLAAVALWQYAHLRSEGVDAEQRSSLMIPTASLFAYALGPLALLQPPWMVVGCTVAAVLLLESREPLHRLVREVAPSEIFTLGKFLVLIGVILPLVPRHPVVSFTPITPFQVWLALVATSTLSYASYLLQTYLPRRSGALLPALLGGLYSSTVTTVALARQQRAAGAARREFSVGIVLATVIMYLRIGAIVAVFDWPLARGLLPMLLGLAALGAVIALLDWRRMQQSAEPPGKLPAPNPLQLATALSFAGMFIAVALLTDWVRREFGRSGLFALAAITGATDIDPFVLNLAQGSVGSLSGQSVSSAILIAASSNNALKACYALAFGGGRACRRPALELLLLAVAGIAAATVYLVHA